MLAGAGLLLAGCGAPGAPPSRQEDVAGLVERALDAQVKGSPEFAALVSAASRACPDPAAARRLGEVAGIAARWSSAVQDGRPKAQAVTEALLATVDWDALVAACAAS